MIVMKFGGTSTQDAGAMANVAQIVHSHLPQHPVVVISAIAKTTNVLEEIGRLSARGDLARVREMLAALTGRHRTILDALIHDSNRHGEVAHAIDDSVREIGELIEGVAILRELTPRTMDAFCSYGELLASRLVAAVLQERGVDAVWLDTKEFMVTDAGFSAALPLMDVIRERLHRIVLPLIEQGKIAVTQGFIGVTMDGRRTTMGRESSDFSAAIIAAALDARDVQIWTDVDGILTADPAVVPVPRKVKMMTFEEAYELSFLGAKVLHPNTMLPALEKNIPIHIFNSRRPHLSGSLVARTVKSQTPQVKSIAYRRNVSLLTVSPGKRSGQYLFWEQVYTILTKHGIVALMTLTSEYSLSIVLDAYADLRPLLHELGTVGAAAVTERKGIVSLVGSRINEIPDLLTRFFAVIPQTGFSLISYGATPSSLSVLVDDGEVEKLVATLHRIYFDDVGDNDTFEVLEHLTSLRA